MKRLKSFLVSSQPDFQENKEAFLKILARYKQEVEKVVNPPSDDPSIIRHKKRGKLFVRERIWSLLDEGSAFLEIGTLAGLGMYEGVRAGGGIVCGVGMVAGKECMIIANDATVKGGTYFPITVKKHLRAQEVALENHLPCIYLVDSGGAFLPLQSEVFPDRDHFGRIFYNQANMSKLRIPQIAVVMGSCTAGGAYVPAMSDVCIIVRNQGTIFLGGPPLVKAATGEDVSAEELGGGDVHAKISGVADYLAEDDLDALRIVRDVVSNIGMTRLNIIDRVESREPYYDPEDIYGLIPKDPKKQFPMRDILARLLDASEFDEFKENYGKTLICGFGRFCGILAGVIANDGILFSESAEKATHFIELCNQRSIPIVFLQNIVGFMVGKEYENKGIAKAGAKMVNAVSTCTVPKITIIVGGSFGAGNYGMAGRAFQPRFLYTWPNSRIAVMGPKQAAEVLTQVKRDSCAARGEKIEESYLKKYYEDIEDKYNRESESFFATARMWDDGVIDPLDTRTTVALALSVCLNCDRTKQTYGVFRM